MGTPIDVAATAAQFVSIAFQTFEGCVKAYKFCRTAQRIGPEGDLLRTRLHVEQYKLESWAERAGLTSSSPNARLNWLLIHDVLQQQEAILTSAEKLKRSYGLDLKEADASGDNDAEADEKSASPRESTGLERLVWSAVRRNRKSVIPEKLSTAQKISTSNGTWKRLQWATAGREKVIKVLDDLGVLNRDLEKLLETADREWLQVSMSALLGDVLSRATSLNDVQGLQKLLHSPASSAEAAVAAAADFKRIRLCLGVDKRSDETQPSPSAKMASSMPTLRMLKEKKFKFATQSPESGLTNATYEGRSVLVEWRKSDDTKFAMLQPHMQALALLLGSTDTSFATMHCIGLLAIPQRHCFGLVYNIPPVPDLPPSVPSHHRTLHELIFTQRRVSLRNRISIACALSEAVLQLHTSGWLHKSIRSDNIIFVAGANSDPETFLDSRPHLVGFDYARPDSALGLTELPDASLSSDLYRHPDKRGPAATGFKKRFDLYALGCLLTEIAVWEDLVGVFSKHDEKDWNVLIDDAEASQRDIKLPSLLPVVESPAFRRDVEHTVGPTFMEAIALCVEGRDEEEEEDDEELSISVQRTVCKKLRQCKV